MARGENRLRLTSQMRFRLVCLMLKNGSVYTWSTDVSTVCIFQLKQHWFNIIYTCRFIICRIWVAATIASAHFLHVCTVGGDQGKRDWSFVKCYSKPCARLCKYKIPTSTESNGAKHKICNFYRHHYLHLF